MPSKGMITIKKEPADLYLAIMTLDDVFNFTTPEAFKEKLDEIKSSDKNIIYQTQAFDSIEAAILAQKEMVNNYNSLSDEAKQNFSSMCVDLVSDEFLDEVADSGSDSGEPPKKMAKASEETSKRVTRKTTAESKAVSRNKSVFALFLPEEVQFFNTKNLAHEALEKFHEENGKQKMDIGIYDCNSEKAGRKGWHLWKEGMPVTKEVAPCGSVVISETGSVDEDKLGAKCKVTDPKTKRILAEVVEEEIKKRLAAISTVPVSPSRSQNATVKASKAVVSPDAKSPKNRSVDNDASIFSDEPEVKRDVFNPYKKYSIMDIVQIPDRVKVACKSKTKMEVLG